MPAKLKPSTKEYIKVNNKMTNKFFTKHYTVSSTSTEELKKLYNSDSYKRKKELIRKELVKRGAWENLKKK
jgi:predicted nuclease of restriction endonuclease-like (RecB) superfamily